MPVGKPKRRVELRHALGKKNIIIMLEIQRELFQQEPGWFKPTKNILKVNVSVIYLEPELNKGIQIEKFRIY